MSFMLTTYALTADAEVVDLDSLDSSLASTLAAGGHAHLTIYSSRGTEGVVAYARSGNQLSVQRTDAAKDWPAQSWVRVEALVPTALPGTDPEPDEPLAGLEVTARLAKTLLSGGGVRLDLATTGVLAGSYGGATVDAYGRFTSIPAGWPATALPTFDPAGTGGGEAGGGVAAEDVAYTAQIGAAVALGDDLQTVVQQIDDAIADLQGAAAAAVESITEGTGISITGAASTPTIGLANSGVNPGTYQGFTVDNKGRVTSYSPPAAGAEVAVTNTAPITSSYNVGTKTYTVGISDASTSAKGAVKLTDPAQITANSVSDPTTVPTWQGILNAMAKFWAPGADVQTGLAGADKITIWDTSASKNVTATLQELYDADVQSKGSVTVSGGVCTLVDGSNVGAVVYQSTGVYRVTLTTALSSSNYHVNVMHRSATPDVRVWCFNTISTTVFDILCVDETATAADVTAFTFEITVI